MSTDLNLFYYGASGGFFCLHLLLLTGQYDCKFERDLKFNQIFQSQWDITSHKLWKSSEVWPDNNATVASNITNKIYYTCNNELEFTKFSGKKIVVYTDIDTQYYLAQTKRAYWFYSIDIMNHNLAEKYNIIKGKDWPSCNSNEQFNKLPKWIIDECINEFNFGIYLIDIPTVESISISHNNERIYTKLKTLIESTEIDILVKYQDLIKTNGEVLFDQLGITGNPQCKEFVDMYLQLHTDEQKMHLLK